MGRHAIATCDRRNFALRDGTWKSVFSPMSAPPASDPDGGRHDGAPDPGCRDVYTAIMAVREVIRMGHPVLRQVAQPVGAFGTPELRSLVTDMDDTMRALSGAGIAAPQVGVSLRVVIFEVTENPRYPHVQPIPYTVLVNPVLTPLGEDTEEGWEGCLSVPGMRGLVPRYRRLRYTGYDLEGTPIDRTVEGFHARVVQHEVDHLDGILYPQRVRDLRNFGFEDVLAGQMTPMPD